jgi:hypothetical protein
MPHPRKLIGHAQNFAFKPRTRLIFSGICERSQKVSSSLVRGTIETHVNKELLHIAGVPKVDLPSLIKYHDLVKNL